MPDHVHALVPASYVYLLRGEDVLLQQRRNTGYMEGHWVAGAVGHVEPGETARQAAAREAHEEIGVSIPPHALELVSVMQRTDGTDDPGEQRLDWFWICREWHGEPRVCETEKAEGIAWFPLHRLPDPIPDYERHILEKLRTGTVPLHTAFGFEHSDVTMKQRLDGDPTAALRATAERDGFSAQATEQNSHHPGAQPDALITQFVHENRAVLERLEGS